jgi:hypothetical protein
MMADLISIQRAVDNFKELIETSIISGGIAAKEAMIRSSKPINNIHEAVKSELIRSGISPSRIHPPIGATSPELKLAGFIKQKHQDVCVSPEGYIPEQEKLTEGILREETDHYGRNYTERTISINVRSQMSSLAKNFDTLYERTIAEAQNLHVRCPRMVLGEVYMIPVKEYDAEAMKNKKIKFIDRIGAVEKYIKSFQAINGRIDYSREDYKYERVCLLLVDFEPTPAKIYCHNSELYNDGLLDKNSDAVIDELAWDTFTLSILKTYNARFGKDMDN